MGSVQVRYEKRPPCVLWHTAHQRPFIARKDVPPNLSSKSAKSRQFYLMASPKVHRRHGRPHQQELMILPPSRHRFGEKTQGKASKSRRCPRESSLVAGRAIQSGSSRLGLPESGIRNLLAAPW